MEEMKSGIFTVNSFMYDIAIVCESEKKRKKGSHKTEFVVRDGDLEYESIICWMVA
jgi:hypothetical protein